MGILGSVMYQFWSTNTISFALRTYSGTSSGESSIMITPAAPPPTYTRLCLRLTVSPSE